MYNKAGFDEKQRAAFPLQSLTGQGLKKGNKWCIIGN